MADPLHWTYANLACKFHVEVKRVKAIIKLEHLARKYKTTLDNVRCYFYLFYYIIIKYIFF